MMTDRSDYRDIIARLERASGNFSLDGAESLAKVMADALGSRMEYFSACSRALQGSLDASLTLVWEKLPGWRIVGLDIYNSRSSAGIESRDTEPMSYSEGEAPTPALAVLLALFHALEGEA